MHSTRRAFLAALAASGARADSARIGVLCNLDPDETAARSVLKAARDAGFRNVQVKFPWARVSDAYVKALPDWVHGEGLVPQVLSVYVNCCSPETVMMDVREEHLPRAIELAGALGCAHLAAWTGGYSANMAVTDARNRLPQAADAICRFVSRHIKPLEAAKLTLSLESYITLVCPDAPSLRHMLDRLPLSIAAVLDPPNLTPVALYAQRDQVLREMVETLRGRIGVVHMKDFRLNPSGDGYILPGPLEGEMNYPLFMKEIATLPSRMPFIAEHLTAPKFADARRKLLAI